MGVDWHSFFSLDLIFVRINTQDNTLPDIWGLKTINGTAGGRKSPGSPLTFAIKRVTRRVNSRCIVENNAKMICYLKRHYVGSFCMRRKKKKKRKTLENWKKQITILLFFFRFFSKGVTWILTAKILFFSLFRFFFLSICFVFY